MKINSRFHAFVFLMAVLLFSIPFVTIAQVSSWEQEARITAERDAGNDTKQVLWIGGSCIFGVVGGFVSGLAYISSVADDGHSIGVVGGCVLGSAGLLGAYLYEPSVPTARLMGQSPEYILTYSDAYKTKARNLQVRSAVIGLGGSVVSACIFAFSFGSDLIFFP